MGWSIRGYGFPSVDAYYALEPGVWIDQGVTYTFATVTVDGGYKSELRGDAFS